MLIYRCWICGWPQYVCFGPLVRLPCVVWLANQAQPAVAALGNAPPPTVPGTVLRNSLARYGQSTAAGANFWYTCRFHGVRGANIFDITSHSRRCYVHRLSKTVTCTVRSCLYQSRCAWCVDNMWCSLSLQTLIWTHVTEKVTSRALLPAGKLSVHLGRIANPRPVARIKTRQWWETDAGTSASLSVSLLHTKLITKLNFNVTFWLIPGSS